MNIQPNTFTPNHQLARNMAQTGLPVFPCLEAATTTKGAKAPYTKHGMKDATTDLGQIGAWWAKHPGAVVGLPTGELTGLAVVDGDICKETGEVIGEQQIASLGLAHPDAVKVRTQSGGVQFLYKHVPGTRSNSKQAASHVDIRGDGGYIIAPGSVMGSGAGYTYESRRLSEALKAGDLPPFPMDDYQAAVAAEKARNAPKLSERASVQTLIRTPTGLDEVADLLEYVDPDSCGYDQWCSVLMGLHDHTGGGADGLALAEQWSKRGPKYKPGEVSAKWKSFQPGGGIGMGTIADLARDSGADLSAIARKHKSHAAATSDGLPRPNTPDDLDLSHDALASDMGARGWDQDARHIASRSRWFFWTGTHWQADDRLEHMTRTRAYLRDRADELEQWAQRQVSKGDPKAVTWAKDQARNLRHKNTVAAVESLARSNPASVAAPDDFDRDRLLLGTPGGTVDLRTGELRAAQRKDLITKQTAIAPAPRGCAPSLWLRFLSEIFAEDAETIAFMQRAAGYALTGQTSEHKLLFLYGTGRNGKSVFLNTLFDIWGDYARRAASATFLNSQNERHPTDLAGLQGARLVAGSELPKGKTWDESVIKDLTGGDTMTARYMRGDFFDFEPQLTLMIAGNNQPSFRGVDEAIRSRVVLVPFTVTIPAEQRDKGLPDKLKAEGPEILRWAIDGALQWQVRGLDVPDSISAASAEYFDDEDTLGQFLADETEQDATAFVTSTALHQRFVQWADGQGLHSWTLRTLQKELKGRGFNDLRRSHGRGFTGIKLKMGA